MGYCENWSLGDGPLYACLPTMKLFEHPVKRPFTLLPAADLVTVRVSYHGHNAALLGGDDGNAVANRSIVSRCNRSGKAKMVHATPLVPRSITPRLFPRRSF